MTDHVYQVRITQAGGTIHYDHLVRSRDETAIRAALERYPSVPWELWQTRLEGDRQVFVHRPCTCGNEDVMRNLGNACEVSCGRRE